MPQKKLRINSCDATFSSSILNCGHHLLFSLPFFSSSLDLLTRLLTVPFQRRQRRGAPPPPPFHFPVVAQGEKVIYVSIHGVFIGAGPRMMARLL